MARSPAHPPPRLFLADRARVPRLPPPSPATAPKVIHNARSKSTKQTPEFLRMLRLFAFRYIPPCFYRAIMSIFGILILLLPLRDRRATPAPFFGPKSLKIAKPRQRGFGYLGNLRMITPRQPFYRAFPGPRGRSLATSVAPAFPEIVSATRSQLFLTSSVIDANEDLNAG